MLAADYLRARSFREQIIRDTLEFLDDWSPAAENLLLGTAAQESGLGNDLKSGRMLGIYHISPQAHQAIWDKYLINNPDLASRVRGLAGQRSFLRNPHGELVNNLSYATAIAWLIYKRHNLLLPAADNIEALAQLWHRHFHAKASASIEEFVSTYYSLESDDHSQTSAPNITAFALA